MSPIRHSSRFRSANGSLWVVEGAKSRKPKRYGRPPRQTEKCKPADRSPKSHISGREEPGKVGRWVMRLSAPFAVNIARAMEIATACRNPQEDDERTEAAPDLPPGTTRLIEHATTRDDTAAALKGFVPSKRYKIQQKGGDPRQRQIHESARSNATKPAYKMTAHARMHKRDAESLPGDIRGARSRCVKREGAWRHARAIRKIIEHTWTKGMTTRRRQAGAGTEVADLELIFPAS